MQVTDKTILKKLTIEERELVDQAYQEHRQACAENDCTADPPEHFILEWLDVRRVEEREGVLQVAISRSERYERRDFRERYDNRETVKADKVSASSALANHQHRSADDPLCQPDVSTPLPGEASDEQKAI